MKITVFYIPTSSEAEAHSLASLVIEHKLAACANVHPIQSFYPWEGQLKEEPETVLILKTLPEFHAELQAMIENHHTYKVPCIMRWESEVNEAYGHWMRGILTQES